MNEKITTDRIIELMMAQTGRDRTAVQTFVGELTALVNDSLIKDGSTRIKGIGKFRIVPVRERESVTPEGERIVIPAHHWLSYLPDKSLKDRINKPFAIFEAVEASESDAPIETPEDPEREYVDDEDTPADEAPLSTPSFISTPENELTDSEPEPTEPTPAPPAPTAETDDDEEDEGDDDVEPVALIGSTWNNEKSQTMNSEIKKEIAEGWSEGRSVGSKPMTVGEMAAAHLKASQIITPEVTAEKVDTKAPEPAQKDEPKAPLATGRTDTPTPNAGRTNEQRPPRKKPVTVIPPLAPPPPASRHCCSHSPRPRPDHCRSSAAPAWLLSAGTPKAGAHPAPLPSQTMAPTRAPEHPGPAAACCRARRDIPYPPDHPPDRCLAPRPRPAALPRRRHQAAAPPPDRQTDRTPAPPDRDRSRTPSASRRVLPAPPCCPGPSDGAAENVRTPARPVAAKAPVQRPGPVVQAEDRSQQRAPIRSRPAPAMPASSRRPRCICRP